MDSSHSYTRVTGLAEEAHPPYVVSRNTVDVHCDELAEGCLLDFSTLKSLGGCFFNLNFFPLMLYRET